MQTIWEYSPELEAQRVLHNAQGIATGFFKINGFIPLPYPAPTADNIVSFPDLPYLTIPRFWEQAGRINVKTLPLLIPKNLIHQTANLLKQASLPIPNFKHAKEIWSLFEKQIMSEIYRLIPHKLDSISQLIIWPTAFGTGCSFNRHLKHGDPVYIWLREDQGVAAITEAILTSLTRQDVYDSLGGLWQESEIIVDWLLTFSPLANIIKLADPNWHKTLTIKHTRTKQAASLMQKSETFMTKLGVPALGVPALQKLPTNSFTSREKEIINLLISKSPNSATMEEIGDILFKDDLDAYSPAAIAKAMQRLRNRLEKIGISGSYIQTKRGEGYLLVS